MRKGAAFFLLAAFAAAASLGFTLDLSGGLVNLFGTSSDQLAYRGSFPEREFSNPLEFYSLSGAVQDLFLGLRAGGFSAGIAAAYLKLQPASTTPRFFVRNEALGITLSLPAVGLEGWLAGAGVKFELPFAGGGAELFLSGRFYFKSSLRTGAYAGEDTSIYVVDAPFAGYIFNFVGEDYAERKVEGRFSWEAGGGAAFRLYGGKGKLSFWLGFLAAYQSIAWRLLYYDAQNRTWTGKLIFTVKR